MADEQKYTRAEWEALAEKELRGKPLEDLTWMTPEGIPVKPLYTAEDLEEIGFQETTPGFFPFTRGVRASMYANRHLPHVGPTLPGQPLNMTEKMGNMLNALEHAHIYIDQLNARIAVLEAKLAE